MTEPRRRKWTGLWLILISLLSFSSCKSESEIKYEQYVIGGRSLYELHCGNCHGSNGEGLRQLYPSLTNSEKLEDLEYLKCLIKFGTSDLEIDMPGNKELYDLDIAQIITYMQSRWGSKRQIIETEEVSKINC